jgi:hypothetical protein
LLFNKIREGDTEMGKVLDNPIAQLMAVEKQQSPELFMHDSVSAVRVIDLKEARALSQFVPVLVLMAAGVGDKAAAVSSNEAAMR